MRLNKGQSYDRSAFEFTGWSDGQDHYGYEVGSYFDLEGRYLGPDRDGIEPLFEMPAKIDRIGWDYSGCPSYGLHCETGLVFRRSYTLWQGIYSSRKEHGSWVLIGQIKPDDVAEAMNEVASGREAEGLVVEALLRNGHMHPEYNHLGALVFKISTGESWQAEASVEYLIQLHR